MTRRRGIFGSFGDGFRDGYNRHQPSRKRHTRVSFVGRQSTQYRRRKHAAKNVRNTILGVIGLIILLCYCGSFLGLW